MRQAFQINVHRQGYSLYAGDGRDGFHLRPLGVISDGITKNYLAASNRITQAIERSRGRWCFAVGNVDSTARPVVAHGYLFPIEDEHGRIGISLNHGIEVGPACDIDEVVLRISKLISPHNINQISALLSGCSRGQVDPDDVLRFLSEPFEDLADALGVRGIEGVGQREPMRELVHDCGGATAVAWLLMTSSHRTMPAPWEIYELPSGNGSTISTLSTYRGAAGSDRLSSLLRTLVLTHATEQVCHRPEPESPDPPTPEVRHAPQPIPSPPVPLTPAPSLQESIEFPLASIGSQRLQRRLKGARHVSLMTVAMAVVALLCAAFAILTAVVSESDRSKLMAEMSQLRSIDEARVEELEHLRARVKDLEDLLERGTQQRTGSSGSNGPTSRSMSPALTPNLTPSTAPRGPRSAGAGDDFSRRPPDAVVP
jgi:hypothetical protein